MTLATDIVTDLSEFINTDEFATSVTVSPGATYPSRNSDTSTLSAIIDKAYDDSGNVDSSIKYAKFVTSDLTGVEYGSMIEIGADKFKVRRLTPDDDGVFTVVTLETQ